MGLLPSFFVVRPLYPGEYPLSHVVRGLESSPALLRRLGRRSLEELLRKARILLVEREGYMWVEGPRQRIVSSERWWNEAPLEHLYLDLVHEVVHLVQHEEGKDLYDRRYSYVDRPTEREAYAIVVEEARTLNLLSEEDLKEFLRVDWISQEEWSRLLGFVGLKPPNPTPPTPRQDGWPSPGQGGRGGP